MQVINFNTYKRRVTLGSRSVFTIPTVNNLKTLRSLRHNSHNLSTTNTPRANKKRKVIARSFRNKHLCRKFLFNLQKRFRRRFKKPIYCRINLLGTKVEYYMGKNS